MTSSESNCGRPSPPRPCSGCSPTHKLAS